MADDQDWKSLNTFEKIEHKNWNARVEGYKEAMTEMSKADDANDPIFNNYAPLMKKMVLDSNVVAQEKGLEVVLTFVEEANVANKVAADLCPGLVSKCISSARPITKERGISILKMIIEIEKQECVIEELMKGLSSKTPKVVVGCIIVIRDALKEFGPKIVPVKDLFKTLPQMLEDRDKGIREAGKELIIEMYRWIGKLAMTPQLSCLKPVQVTELNAEFDKLPPDKAEPTRYLRSQKPKVVSQPKSVARENSKTENLPVKAAVDPDLDPYEFIDPVTVLSKVPDDFYDKIEEKKWTDRKEALEIIEKLTNHEKLEVGDYGDLVKILIRVIAKDTNVVLVVLAGKVLYQIAHGLRNKFSPYSTPTIQACLEKFKEKKMNVVKSLRDCIDAAFVSSSLDLISEEVVNALGHKTPSVRSETCLFLNRIFEKSTMETLQKKHLKMFIPSIVKLCQDCLPEVRDASFIALGTAMMVVTEKHIKPFLEGIDSVKTARIMECYEKAKNDAQKSSKTATVLEHIKVPESPKENKSKFDKPPVQHSFPKKVVLATPPKAQNKLSAVETIPEIPKETVLSDEDVIEKGTELFGESFMNQIVDKNFKERLTAVQTLQSFIKDKTSSEIPSQLIIKLILLKPGLKDNNVQVLKTKLELIKDIVLNGKFTITIAELCIGDLTEKIGDVKNSDNVKSTLTEMSDNLSLQCVAIQVIKTATENVNIKNLAEALIWIGDAIKDFGFRIEMKDLLPFLKTGLQHTNPNVRQAALKLVGTVSLYVRDVISTLLKDEKSSIKQLIDQEVDSMKNINPPVPTRGLKNVKPTAAGDTDIVINKPIPPTEINREELIPRDNISGKITEEILEQLADKSWKVKKEAFDQINGILNKCSGILGDGLIPLITAVSKVTSDSSKIISKMALLVLINLCNLLTKKDCEKYVRIVAPALFISCNDAKPKNREDVIAALNVWVNKVGFIAITEGGMVVDALKVENPFQRSEVLSWLTANLVTLSQNNVLKKSLSTDFCSDIIPYFYLCLEERSSEVRKKAQDAVLPFMLVFGYEEMLRIHNKHTKLASKDNIKSYLDKAKELLPVNDVGTTKPIVKPLVNVIKSACVMNKEVDVKKTDEPIIVKSKVDSNLKNDVGLQLLYKNNNKKQRLVEDSKKKNLIKSEFIQHIADQFKDNCNHELYENLFCSDAKKYVIALDMLTQYLSEDQQYSIDATKSNLDLILKWLVIRFDETNASVISKGFEYLNVLFTILSKDDNFTLHHQEANSFFPEFILKLGDASVTIRINVLKILRLSLNCYPAKNIVQFVEHVLTDSKNARVKQGCAEFLQLLIDEEKIKVTDNVSLFVTVSRLISERDSGLRTAALNCLVSVHSYMGDALFKLLKELSDKERLMLFEQIKRNAKLYGSGIDTSSTSSASTATIERNVKSPQPKATNAAPSKSLSNDTDEILKEELGLKLISVDEEIKELLQPLDKTTLRYLPVGVSLLQKLSSYSGRTSQSVNINDAITSVIHSINSNDIQISIQSMMQIDEVIKSQINHTHLLAYTDNLIMSIAMQLKATLSKLTDEKYLETEIIDMFKGMLAILVSIFSHKDLAMEINRDRLMNLMQQILKLVINERLVALAEGGTIIRGLNILSVRIIECSDQTRMLSSLFRMMMDCLKNNDSTSKYMQLIFKCIWSMTRNLINTVNTIDLVVILRDILTFYNDFPPNMWERSHNDVPIRTVKTVIYSIINHKGSGVLEALYQIPEAPGRSLDQYIRKSYAKLKYPIPNILPSFEDIRDTSVTPRLSEKYNNSTKTNNRPYLDELKQIFDKIGIATENKEGLNELFDFKIKYPYVDLSRYLNHTTPYFQKTIESGLRTISQERGQPMISLFGLNEFNQLNNSGIVNSSEDDVNELCVLNTDMLHDRLNDVYVTDEMGNEEIELGGGSFRSIEETKVPIISDMNSSSDRPTSNLSILHGKTTR